MTNPRETILLVDDEILLARRPSLRVLFMWGYAEDVLVTNVGLVPGAAFLSKASEPKALVTKVREVLATEVSS